MERHRLLECAIGFLLLRFAHDPVAAVTPAAARIRGNEPITASVALLCCIRNEEPARVIRNLLPMLDGLAAVGSRFHLYVLSDTSDAATAAAEAERFGALAADWHGRIALTYRRRDDNAGFKAGNIRDFCLRWGGAHDFAVTLDADSFIPASAILRMVRIMQAAPEIGILQGLVVGMPSTSAFARIFQFGMRLGMVSYTTGSAWWQGDCGPHWGHNSVLRLRPFTTFCHIPPLPTGGAFGGAFGGALGGEILSHDQIEAVLMRRAGYEVRVLPEDHLGWEENPPTLLEFIRRDIRWCQGNMQYWAFPRREGAACRQPLSACVRDPDVRRLAGLDRVSGARHHRGHRGASVGLHRSDPRARAARCRAGDVVRAQDRHGGRHAAACRRAQAVRRRSAVRPQCGDRNGVLPDAVADHVVRAHGVLARLLFGGRVGWGGQAREDHAVPLSHALARLWPQTVLGLACLGALAVTVPAAIPYALLIAGGLALAVPLCVVTANSAVGAALVRAGIGRLPEETAPSPLDALSLPALRMTRRTRS